jgi:hypothetical protein
MGRPQRLMNTYSCNGRWATRAVNSVTVSDHSGTGAGCLAWAEQGLADTPKTICNATSEYQHDQDIVGRWLEECTESNLDGETSKTDLYANYKFWCFDNGLRAASEIALSRRLSERGLTVRKSQAARIGGRFVRFGWTGCPDVLGQLKDGRLLGVEVKAEKGRRRPEQTIFLARIRAAVGAAFMARDCRDVLRELNCLTGQGD